MEDKFISVLLIDYDECSGLILYINTWVCAQQAAAFAVVKVLKLYYGRTEVSKWGWKLLVWTSRSLDSNRSSAGRNSDLMCESRR